LTDSLSPLLTQIPDTITKQAEEEEKKKEKELEREEEANEKLEDTITDSIESVTTSLEAVREPTDKMVEFLTGTGSGPNLKSTISEIFKPLLSWFENPDENLEEILNPITEAAQDTIPDAIEKNAEDVSDAVSDAADGEVESTSGLLDGSVSKKKSDDDGDGEGEEDLKTKLERVFSTPVVISYRQYLNHQKRVVTCLMHWSVAV
jgi:hypothetical protein